MDVDSLRQKRKIFCTKIYAMAYKYGRWWKLVSQPCIQVSSFISVPTTRVKMQEFQYQKTRLLHGGGGAVEKVHARIPSTLGIKRIQWCTTRSKEASSTTLLIWRICKRSFYLFDTHTHNVAWMIGLCFTTKSNGKKKTSDRLFYCQKRDGRRGCLDLLLPPKLNYWFFFFYPQKSKNPL